MSPAEAQQVASPPKETLMDNPVAKQDKWPCTIAQYLPHKESDAKVRVGYISWATRAASDGKICDFGEDLDFMKIAAGQSVLRIAADIFSGSERISRAVM